VKLASRISDLTLTNSVSDQSLKQFYGIKEETKSGFTSPRGSGAKDFSEAHKTPPKKKNLSPNAGENTPKSKSKNDI